MFGGFLRSVFPYVLSLLFAVTLYKQNKPHTFASTDSSLQLTSKIYKDFNSEAEDTYLLYTLKDSDKAADVITTLKEFQKSTTPLEHKFLIKTEDGSKIDYTLDKVSSVESKSSELNFLLKIPTNKLLEHSKLYSQLQIGTLFTQKAELLLPKLTQN